MGTCPCLPHHGGPWAPLPILPFPGLTHPSAQISQRSPQGLKADGITEPWPQPDSNHHPLLGPPLGKSRVLRRKDTNGLTNGVPGLSLKESATPLLTGSQRARRPQQAKATAGHCLAWRKGQPPIVSGVSMPGVSGSLSSLQGLWCRVPQPHLP